ncbi:MAG: adenylate/guanylate cyclase domain-containing protein [Rhodospirillales bacterium]
MNNRNPSLLVAEDEPFNREILLNHLKANGYENIVVVKNGTEALEQIEKAAFDLILLDILMPGVNGDEVLKSIKSNMATRDVPVIMISGNQDMDSIVKCIELGAVDYIRKPFNPTLLQARIKACLDNKRLRDQQESYVRQMKAEKKRADALLSVILPAEIARELSHRGKVQPRRYENVGILFCDIVGFTSFCDGRSPEDVVTFLQALFEKFEEIVDDHGLVKIKTIGDEFMATAGLLRPLEDTFLATVKCGLDMIAAAEKIPPHCEVRVGVHQGSVVGGVVGRQKYQFDVWGDCVNVAARMVTTGTPGSVTMVHESWLRVEEYCRGRMMGNVGVKGKGTMQVVECFGIRDGKSLTAHRS